MAEIKAADVAKLRKATGAGMMDCKKALQEAEGDFDQAVDILRKKGQKIANKRADREASEGAVLGKVSADKKKAVLIALNCETDFVAKNQDFVDFAYQIVDTALENNPGNIDELKALPFEKGTLADEITNKIGVIGEKLDLSYFNAIEAESTYAYIHPGNQLATIVGFSIADVDEQVAKDVAMQIAAMNPVAIDQDEVPQDVIDKEIEIGKDQARQEGKPEAILEKIAMGKLNKFFKDNTLLNQDFVKDNKKSIKQYLAEYNKDLKVTKFYRFTLNV